MKESFFKQYDKITKNFINNTNVEVENLSKEGATEGGAFARNVIRQENRIDTGKMIRSTTGATYNFRGQHKFKIRSRAINERSEYNYSLAQNFGTSRGIKGIFFIDKAGKFVEEVVLSDNRIYNSVEIAWNKS